MVGLSRVVASPLTCARSYGGRSSHPACMSSTCLARTAAAVSQYTRRHLASGGRNDNETDDQRFVIVQHNILSVGSRRASPYCRTVSVHPSVCLSVRDSLSHAAWRVASHLDYRLVCLSVCLPPTCCMTHDTVLRLNIPDMYQCHHHHHHQFIWIKPNTNAKAM